MNQRIDKFVFALLCLFCVTAQPVKAEQAPSSAIPMLKMYTEDWVPFQFKTDNGDLDGAAVTLLEYLLKEIGSTQDQRDMSMVPWARALQALSEENTIVFSMTVTEERLPLYQWVGPIYEVKSYIYVKADSTLTQHDFSVANQLTTAVVIGDVNTQYMPRLNVDAGRIYNVPTPESPLSMLSLDRVDFIIDNSLNFSEMAQRNGLNKNNFKQLFVVDHSIISYAVSLSTSKTLVQKMQTALNKVRSSTIYAELLKKYDLP